ncbi:MAG: DNA protecting protein DprA [Candidatus Buchananbacteria bacterium RBG_13_36_9]|uniref:DNA protecting protein DprA n=1 Tax=Candidatus Buchananbacteria bacterium RBG_13_36_9 TaxID=1797530 RepID=A0A1G1XQE3_9BACT|nr:MAG: DNA protecting protein DprA [Candidatus Buchananbacteria bacterium RBG_13_36_9]
MQNDLKYWIAISQFAKIGAARFKKLYNYFPDMQSAWAANLLELRQSGLEDNIAQEFIIIRREINPDQELEKVQEENIEIITIKDQNYSKLLKEIFNPPALLYAKGNLENLNTQFNIAVVGTRKISNYGKQITPEIVKPLAQNGFTITSGLALGVDALAHQAAVEVKGKTIAVLGSGLDQQSIYPSSNRYLAKNILDNGGTIISEFPIGMLPLKHNFPTRNRIIAGLSLGTVVIEAAETSGALITAFLALEQNREVFAVPGSLFNKNSLGTHKLIQKGAKLITGYQDILDELNLKEVKNFVANQQVLPDTAEEKLIMQNLSHDPIHVDQIIKNTQLPASLISGCLSLMEMKGMIKNLGGQNYILLS